MWSYKSEVTGLEVVEGFSCFYLYYKGFCTGMGDGVDMFYDPEAEEAVSPGTDRFYELLKKTVDDPETVEAYFGEKL